MVAVAVPAASPMSVPADAPPPPRHVAIIMDGNGRWAKARGMPRTAGHRRGVEAVREVSRGAAELGISHLTLFGFSTENWKRPAEEVGFLMGLLRQYLRHELGGLVKDGARLRVLGSREGLAADIVELIDIAEERTRANTRINLSIALNYGSRAEISAAARRLAQAARSGALDPDDIDETRFARELTTQDLPDPDLLIRTSGEQRISNFLLWQCAYAEMMFVDTLWPDFGKLELVAAIEQYHGRERRYGALAG